MARSKRVPVDEGDVKRKREIGGAEVRKPQGGKGGGEGRVPSVRKGGEDACKSGKVDGAAHDAGGGDGWGTDGGSYTANNSAEVMMQGPPPVCLPSRRWQAGDSWAVVDGTWRFGDVGAEECRQAPRSPVSTSRSCCQFRGGRVVHSQHTNIP